MQNILLLLFFLGVSQIVSCGSASDAPNKDELRQGLNDEVPKYYTIRSFDIEASENAGSKVQPLYRYRFRAAAELQEDTYKEIAKEGNVVFITLAEGRGKRAELFGIAEASLSAGKWRIRYRLENYPIRGNEVPRKFFSQKTIIKGSSEEVSYQAQLKEQEKARLNAIAKQRSEIQKMLSSGRPLRGVHHYHSVGWNKAEILVISKSFDQNSGRFVGELRRNYTEMGGLLERELLGQNREILSISGELTDKYLEIREINRIAPKVEKSNLWLYKFILTEGEKINGSLFVKQTAFMDENNFWYEDANSESQVLWIAVP